MVAEILMSVGFLAMVANILIDRQKSRKKS
jgi:hypothetical protein